MRGFGRPVIVGALLAGAALCWALLLTARLWDGMDMPAGALTMGLPAAAFLAMWVVMMAAMMFPSAAPMVLTFHRVQASRRHSKGAAGLTALFLAGYMLVWSLAGIVFYAAARAAEAIGQAAALSPETSARICGAVLIAAGLYQLTPLKNACLSKCRAPVAFIMNAWRGGADGAVRMGVLHGAYCLGCCWLLFVVMFPLGIMSLAATAALTLLICAEKFLPSGRLAARVAAACLVAYGAAVIAIPAALPTFTNAAGMGGMEMGDPPMPAGMKMP